jgi:hypothetical protein
MRWADIASGLARIAPVLGTALAGPAGTAVGGLIAQALGVDAAPDAVAQAIERDPEAALTLRRLANDHERALTGMVLEAETQRHAQINQTIRAEAASTDAYVRRWRPSFGYAVAATWVAQTLGIMVALAYAIAQPAHAADIITAISQVLGAMTVMWSLALAVLGVNVTSRSKDKQVAAGQSPGGLVEAIQALRGR